MKIYMQQAMKFPFYPVMNAAIYFPNYKYGRHIWHSGRVSVATEYYYDIMHARTLDTRLSLR